MDRSTLIGIVCGSVGTVVVAVAVLSSVVYRIHLVKIKAVKAKKLSRQNNIKIMASWASTPWGKTLPCASITFRSNATLSAWNSEQPCNLTSDNRDTLHRQPLNKLAKKNSLYGDNLIAMTMVIQHQDSVDNSSGIEDGFHQRPTPEFVKIFKNEAFFFDAEDLRRKNRHEPKTADSGDNKLPDFAFTTRMNSNMSTDIDSFLGVNGDGVFEKRRSYSDIFTDPLSAKNEIYRQYDSSGLHLHRSSGNFVNHSQSDDDNLSGDSRASRYDPRIGDRNIRPNNNYGFHNIGERIDNGDSLLGDSSTNRALDGGHLNFHQASASSSTPTDIDHRRSNSTDINGRSSAGDTPIRVRNTPRFEDFSRTVNFMNAKRKNFDYQFENVGYSRAKGQSSDVETSLINANCRRGNPAKSKTKTGNSHSLKPSANSPAINPNKINALHEDCIEEVHEESSANDEFVMRAYFKEGVKKREEKYHRSPSRINLDASANNDVTSTYFQPIRKLKSLVSNLIRKIKS